MPNHKPYILVVDDDPPLRALLQRYLREQDFEVVCVADGQQMDQALATQHFELIVLDLMLPGEDGLSLARRLRQSGKDMRIIMLSARGEDIDRIVGLEVGADDYLAKPFNPRELLARIRAVLRRGTGAKTDHTGEQLQFGPYTLYLTVPKCTREDKEIELTRGEYTLLKIMAQHPHRTLSRDRLIDLLKGYERHPYDRSVDVRVTRLRKKIEPDPSKPIYLRTVWGEGYVFTPDTAS